jgi:hypothetical protein
MLMEKNGTEAGVAAETKEAVEGAKKIIASLLLVRKHFSLYPDGHTITVNALESLHTLMAAFLEKHGELRVNVEKDRLLCFSDVVYSGEQEEGALPFTLFRDGLRWVEFMEGIESYELREFLKIIIRYSFLSDEAEGDIVTSLWEMQLPHVRYEVSDFAWGADDSDSALASEGSGKGRSIPKEGRPPDRQPLQAPPIDQSEIVCTPEEDHAIQEMVRREEEKPQSTYLDDLFDSLLQYREQENFELVLETLSEEFKSFFAQMKFYDAAKTLSRLKYVLDTCRAESIPAAVQAIEGFYQSLSDPSFLTPLQDVWPRVEPGQIGEIREILSCLQPAAISTLSRMLTFQQPPELQKLLVETIVNLASRDLRPLEALLKSNDEMLVQMLVQVIASLDGEQPMKILLTLIRHPVERVRQEAMKVMFKKHPTRIKEVYNLIDDPDESIRRVVLKQIALSRERSAERFLLSYLELNKKKGKDYNHIIACFTALGQCGSSRSIAYLRKTLFEWAWMPGFWNRAYREGAAEALSILATDETVEILRKARHSLFPSLRKIARRAG